MRFIFEGPPIPQQRARFFRANGRLLSYDPQKKEKKKIKNKIDEKFKEIYESIDYIESSKLSKLLKAEYFLVDFIFIMQIPKNISTIKKNKLWWGLELPGKSDLDNLAKFYLDCATGQIWSNDNQIIDLKMIKKYGEKPMTIMDVSSRDKKIVIKDIEKILSMFSPREIDDMLKNICNATVLLDQVMAENFEEKEMIEIVKIICFLSEFSSKFSKIKKEAKNILQNIKDYEEFLNKLKTQEIKEKICH